MTWEICDTFLFNYKLKRQFLPENSNIIFVKKFANFRLYLLVLTRAKNILDMLSKALEY